MNISGKKISIIGAVRSGVGAAKLTKQLGGIPFVSDYSSEENIKEYLMQLSKENIEYEFNGHSGRVYDCDLMITSPGVPSDSDVLLNAAGRGIKVVSEIEFAGWLCMGSIIAITGTNGKTTTTSLCNHTLIQSGLTSYAAGNIGNAFSEIVFRIKDDEYVALETSSFQLDHIDKFKPKFSLILNITPDHLNRYNNSFDEYKNSKLKIYKNQDDNDFFISNKDDSGIPADIENTKVNRYYFSLHTEVENGSFAKNGKLYFRSKGRTEEICSINDLSIKGEHNVSNSLAVISVARLIGIEPDKIRAAFKSFPGVEHRLEFVREIEGITFINDSKATNIDSVWYALRSFDQPIFLILGGKDKGNDYAGIKDLVKERVKKIYAIGSSAEKIYKFFNGIVETEIMPSLESAVASGRNEAEENEIVLLSPACASFDMFENFEHRGQVFKDIVNQLI